MTADPGHREAHRAIDAVWRIESPRLVAGLVRMVRDVDLAEELAQDALVAALEHWPADGVPDNPGAWLMATAKRRAIDRMRRNTLVRNKHEAHGHELEGQTMGTIGKPPDDDDRLTPATTCCGCCSPPVTRRCRPRPRSR